jgi:hypothetical protein
MESGDDMARVHVRKETTNDPAGNWQLWFQWCRYELDDGIQYGYRFIWRRPDGGLQAARGQARIPSIEEGKALMDKAISEGWGNRDWGKMENAIERLKKEGCVVGLSTGYVGWPNEDAVSKAPLTQEIIDDTHLIREWS